MTRISGEWIQRGALRLRRVRLLAVLALTLAATALAAVVALRAGASVAVASAVALASGLLAALGNLLPSRRILLSAEQLAAHLDRTVPEAEESTGLLLADPATLPVLARLQRRRTEVALARLAAPPALPRGPWHRQLRGALVLALLTLAALVLPGPGAATGRGNPVPSAGEAPVGPVTAPPALAGVRVTVTPPAYTDRPARTQDNWDLEVEEGARIHWEIGVTGSVAGGRLVTASGDTLPGKVEDGRLVVTAPAHHSTLYRVLLDAAVSPPVASEDYRITVRLDAPPVVAIVRPDLRTTIQPGEPLTLPVEVLASDDFGVDSTALVATVTKGQGEGVKFREQRLPLPRRERGEGRTLVLGTTLDLAALGLEPGDELYFHVVATDRRLPLANESRSETVFVTLVDTTRQAAGPGAGVSLDIPPDYFRSQRQLIIDTEKLLADQRGLPAQVFRDRSNGLGIDQGLLRLRYGQFMGDEYEGTLASGREAHGDDPADEPPSPPAVDPITGLAAVDPFADIAHLHDDPENATLLNRDVKAKLRQAIGAMWQAELRLRLAQPRQSLPFQQQALVLLQEIRQDARAYVKRVGFDPPPLEPDRKRLTGDLTRIQAPRVERAAAPEWSLPALRQGLEVLQRLRAGAPVQDGDVVLLERAGQDLAQLAVDQAPPLLESLRSLRLAIASLAPGAPACAECLARAEQGFWRALPDPMPAARARRDPGSGLASRYFRMLDGGR